MIFEAFIQFFYITNGDKHESLLGSVPTFFSFFLDEDISDYNDFI